MLGAPWIHTFIGLAIGYLLMIILTGKLRRLKARDRSGYAGDLTRSGKLRIFWNAAYFAILILVDKEVLSERPWYTIATTIFMAGLTITVTVL